MPRPCQRVGKTPSPIIDVLLEKYPDVKFNLAPGCPSATPHPHALAACQARLSEPTSISHFSHYNDVIGSQSLRYQWLEYIFQRKVDSFDSVIPDHEIMITAGANQAFINVALTICDPGDDVIVVLPYYFSHVNALLMSNVNLIYVKVTTSTLCPSVPEIEKAITPRTRACVIVNPGNPSSVVMPQQLLDELSELCRRHKVYLCIDEAYREYDFSGSDAISTVYSPQLHSHMIKFYTMSKCFGMAGWRVGAVLYPRTLSSGMRKMQDTIPTHAAMFSQALAAEALKHKPTHMESVLKVRNIFLNVVRPIYARSSISDMFVEPTGAFYLFLPYRRPGDDQFPKDDEVVHFLATDYGVLTVPGYGFGMEGYIRVCYGALREEDAPDAARALGRGLSNVLKECQNL